MVLDPITAGLDFGKGVLDVLKRFIADPDKAAEAALSITTMQMQVNAIEAQHHSIFVAGWRPFIGWVCGTALAFYYIPRILLNDAMWVWACTRAGALVPYPEMPIGDLIGLLTGMLGFGLLRSLDKGSNGK